MTDWKAEARTVIPKGIRYDYPGLEPIIADALAAAYAAGQTAGRVAMREEAVLPVTWKRLDGYYFGFVATGVELIDRILSAVACAGKAFHHTEGWTDEVSHPYAPFLRGSSPIDWIQNAANDAAAAITRALPDVSAAPEGTEEK